MSITNRVSNWFQSQFGHSDLPVPQDKTTEELFELFEEQLEDCEDELELVRNGDRDAWHLKERLLYMTDVVERIEWQEGNHDE